MKTRAGFVSNSSAMSFCIYGWTGSYTEMRELEQKLKETHPELGVFEFSHPDEDSIVGVGNSAYEFDHYMDEDWQEYESKPPTKEEMEALDKVAEEMGLPAPMMESCTWWG